MAMSDVTNAMLIADWLNTKIVVENADLTNFSTIIKESDASKVSEMTDYLNTRIANNTAAIADLSAYVTAQTAALTADSLACNIALTQLVE